MARCSHPSPPPALTWTFYNDAPRTYRLVGEYVPEGASAPTVVSAPVDVVTTAPPTPPAPLVAAVIGERSFYGDHLSGFNGLGHFDGSLAADGSLSGRFELPTATLTAEANYSLGIILTVQQTFRLTDFVLSGQVAADGTVTATATADWSWRAWRSTDPPPYVLPWASMRGCHGPIELDFTGTYSGSRLVLQEPDFQLPSVDLADCDVGGITSLVSTSRDTRLVVVVDGLVRDPPDRRSVAARRARCGCCGGRAPARLRPA